MVKKKKVPQSSASSTLLTYPDSNGKIHHNLDVFCRFRPADDRKPTIYNCTEHSFDIMKGKSVYLGHQKGTNFQEKMFHLDIVFDDEATQKEVYHVVGEPIIRDVVQGFNGCILCYGQTGSGKTYSLFGDMTHAKSPRRGLIPRSIRKLFDIFRVAGDVAEVVIKCSFIEIYNNQLRDLLVPRENVLTIRETVFKRVYIQGLHEEYVSSFDDVYDVLQIGFRNRTVGATLMNEKSSRSHCILTLNIKQMSVGGEKKESILHFCDLAGSESVRKTGSTGIRLKEAQGINTSLLALQNVVRALTTRKEEEHVPYRDSKLTYLLSNTLGGNSKAAMLFTCSLETYNYRETYNTLLFAERCKLVENQCRINKVQSERELKVVIELYKDKLMTAQIRIAELEDFIDILNNNGCDGGLSFTAEEREIVALSMSALVSLAIFATLKEFFLVTLLSILLVSTQHAVVDPPTGPTPCTPEMKAKIELFLVDPTKALKEGHSEQDQCHLKVDHNDDGVDSNDSSMAPGFTEKLMLTLNQSIEAKDKAMEGLNEEIAALRKELYVERERKKRTEEMETHSLVHGVLDSMVLKVVEEVEEQRTLDEQQEALDETQSALDDERVISEQLRLEKEQIEKERLEIVQWANELEAKLEAKEREKVEREEENVKNRSIVIGRTSFHQIQSEKDKKRMCCLVM